MPLPYYNILHGAFQPNNGLQEKIYRPIGLVCLTGFVRPQSAGGKRRRGSPTERYVISSAGQAQKKGAVANSERPEVVCLTGFVRPQSAGGKRRRGSPTERYVISSAGQAQKKGAVANSERPKMVCLTGFVRPQSAGGKRRRGSPTERYVISSAGQAQKKGRLRIANALKCQYRTKRSVYLRQK